MTLGQMCCEINNYFDYDRKFGQFTISDGTMQVEDAQSGQYIRIVGSVFNDGVYQYPLSELTDETFEGAVWLMAVPVDALDLLSAISSWETENATALNSPYQSESFGGYSYSIKSGGNTSNGDGGITWQSHFATALNKWRKICPY